MREVTLILDNVRLQAILAALQTHANLLPAVIEDVQRQVSDQLAREVIERGGAPAGTNGGGAHP